MDAPAAGPITMDTPLGSALTFQAMEGVEDLSVPFQLELDARSEQSGIKAEDLLGESVTVHLELEAGEIRHWNGQVARFAYLETGDDGVSWYRLTLRPWLWQLGVGADCRIFQHLSVPDIVTKVFHDRGFRDFEQALFDKYEALDFVVQYRESDLDFVSRLLEREGIYYFFRHENGKHTLVLADDPSAHDPMQGYQQVPYAVINPHRDRTMQYVRRWRAEAQVEPAVYAVADFNFVNPRVTLYGSRGDRGIRVYDYPGGFSTFDEADQAARLRLEQARRDERGWHGETNARGLTVGDWFELEGHPREDQNRKYLIISARVRLRGADLTSSSTSAEEPFASEFRAIDRDTPFRPPLLGRKPRMTGPQTATVVGAAQNEIWTDQFGRIKVQFHWDREGKRDENSSCWIRVAQSWAGSGWGTQFIPRVGQEVIVDFLEGDPDRPIVTGCVYNAANMQPFPLPGSETQSGIRTMSTPFTSILSGNEIRFEDRVGGEELFIQAQKDLNTVVKNDESDLVARNRSISVGANQVLSVGLDVATQVGHDDTLSVAHERSIRIGADDTRTVGGDNALTVTGDDSAEIGGNASLSVTGDTRETLVGDVERTVGGRVNGGTKGETLLTFGSDYTERHAGHRTIVVGSGSAHRTAVVHVEGSGRAYASKSIEFEVLESLTLVCGDSQILVSPKGITLASPQITFVGKAVNATASTFGVSASDAVTLGGNTVTVQTSGAKLALDSSTASLQGSQVKLGSGSGSSSQASDKPATITRIQLNDPRGKPRANARILLTKGGQGGEQRMTVLDENGVLELVGDEQYQIVFPDELPSKQ
jgi:type VI secretion system secreted protein VgrG